MVCSKKEICSSVAGDATRVISDWPTIGTIQPWENNPLDSYHVLEVFFHFSQCPQIWYNTIGLLSLFVLLIFKARFWKPKANISWWNSVESGSFLEWTCKIQRVYPADFSIACQIFLHHCQLWQLWSFVQTSVIQHLTHYILHHMHYVTSS